jgi:hypothetical protein
MDTLTQGFIPSDSQIFPLMADIVMQDISTVYTKKTALTIAALESGDAKSELIIIDQLMRAGYKIKTIVLVDVVYAKPTNALSAVLDDWRLNGRIEHYHLVPSYPEFLRFMDTTTIDYIFTIHPNTSTYRNQRLLSKYASGMIRWFMNGDKQNILTVLQQQKVTMPGAKTQRSYRISQDRKKAIVEELGVLDAYQSQSKPSFRSQDSWIFDVKRRRKNMEYLVAAGFTQQEAQKYCDFKNPTYDDSMFLLTEFRRWVPKESALQLSTLVPKTANNLRRKLNLLASRGVMSRRNHSNVALWNSFAGEWW